jgi:serine/threonine-protein kinase RsbW
VAAPDSADPLRLVLPGTQPGLLYPWLEMVAATFGLTGRIAYGIHVAVEEIVANALMHALTDPSESLEIEARRHNGDIELTIVDPGVPFDPTAHSPQPEQTMPLPDMAVGGRGLKLVRHYARAMRYVRRDDRNVLTLVFAPT